VPTFALKAIGTATGCTFFDILLLVFIQKVIWHTGQAIANTVTGKTLIGLATLTKGSISSIDQEMPFFANLTLFHARTCQTVTRA
jgi:hypothetical protein